MNILNDLAIKHGTDKKIEDGILCHGVNRGHGYTTHYHEMLKDRSIKNMLEIGILRGNSIKMWNEYFKNECWITGVDHSEKNGNKKGLEKENIRIMIGRQGDFEFLKTLCDRKYDFIVDDGSHKTEDHIISFCGLFTNVSEGGLYCIEDLQVAKKTVEIFKSIQNNGGIHAEYIPKNILDLICKIEFYVDNKLCVIHKISDIKK